MTWDFLQQASQTPFSVALALMFMFLAFEVVSMAVGASLSQLIDGIMPDVDVGLDVDSIGEIEAASIDIAGEAGVSDSLEIPDATSQGWLISALAWLTVGRVPALVVLVVLLTTFGLIGLVLQASLYAVLGITLPAVLASIPAIAVALPVTRFCGLTLAKIMPKVQSDAVSQEAMIGQTALIFRGNAQSGQPAEAKLTDRYGYTHYVLLEPDDEAETLNQGETVLIVNKQASIYRAIRPKSDALA